VCEGRGRVFEAQWLLQTRSFVAWLDRLGLVRERGVTRHQMSWPTVLRCSDNLELLLEHQTWSLGFRVNVLIGKRGYVT
jgi:hypothetical protein